MPDRPAVTESEERLAWERDRGLVVLVRTALLREKQARLRDAMGWHLRRSQRLIHELRVVRGIEKPVPKTAPKPCRRKPRAWLRAVR